MNRSLGKYFLSLCILLLSVYGFTHAYASIEDSVTYHSTCELSFQQYFRPGASNQPQIRNQFSSDSKYSVRTYTEKNEEESFGVASLKTYTNVGNYFTRFFSGKLKVIFLNIQERSLLCSHWCRSSSEKYSVLCQFRI